MPDFRVTDQQHAREVWRRVGLAAAGLRALAGSYSMSPAVLSDGWVPAHWVTSWPGGRRLAQQLVDAGLWAPSERNGQPGWQDLEWSEQTPAAKFLADRGAAKERMRKLRQHRRSPERSPEQPPNVPRTNGERAPERSPEVRQLPHPHPGTHQGGERPASNRAPAQRPPDRCPQHQGIDQPPPCGQCADARRAAEAWDRHHATAQREAVRGCPLCDGDGWRYLDPAKRYLGVESGPDARCTHIPGRQP